jgi:hypothetical protein
MFYVSERGALSDALEAITGVVPPAELVLGFFCLSDLDDGQVLALQDWCSLNARPTWATGESIMDAAFLMIERAIENGNIQDQGN